MAKIYFKIIFFITITFSHILAKNWQLLDRKNNILCFEWVTQGDLHEEEHLYLEAFTELYKDLPEHYFGTLGRVGFLKKVFDEEKRELSNRYFISVKKDNHVIGFADFKKSANENEVYLVLIAISSDCRHCGIGEELILTILNKLPNTQKITLDTRKKNKDAMNFYKKLGLKECACFDKTIPQEYYTGFEGNIMKLTKNIKRLEKVQPSNVFLFPKPTGKYAVGVTSFYFKDENRQEIHSDNLSAKRELIIQIWYPAKGEISKSSLPYHAEEYAEMLKIENNITSNQVENLIKDLKKIRTYAHQEIAPENTQKYPIIIFSPGFNGTRTNNTANCEDLASHGYIVVGIDPTYVGSMIKFPDGRIIKHKEINVLEQNVDDIEQQIWIEDAVFVLDQIEKLNQNKNFILNGIFDLEKIGIFGHSYGGSTAAQLCRQDQRCKAGISLDGGLFGKNPTEKFDKPFMFILTQNWPWAHLSEENLEQMKITKEQFENVRKKWLEYIPTLCNAIGKNTYQIKIKNLKHNDFSDSTLIKEISSLKQLHSDVGSLNGFRATEIINSYIVNFFDKHLKEKTSELLDYINKKFIDEVEDLSILLKIKEYNKIETLYPSYVDKNCYGTCLRAANNLKKGTIIATANFEKTDKVFIANHPSEEYRYVAITDVTPEGLPIYGRIRGKWAFCNHSCDPNCDINDQWQIITNRTVKQGDELTTAYDAFVYNLPWQDSWSFECKCGAPCCKKIINCYRYDIIYPIKNSTTIK